MLQKGHKYKVQIKKGTDFKKALKLKDWQKVDVYFLKQVPFQWSMCRITWTEYLQLFWSDEKLVKIMPLANPELDDKYFICKTNAVALAVQKDLMKQWLTFASWEAKPRKNIAKDQDYKNWVVFIIKWDCIFFEELTEENLETFREEWITNFYSKGKSSDEEVWPMKAEKRTEAVVEIELEEAKEEAIWLLKKLKNLLK